MARLTQTQKESSNHRESHKRECPVLIWVMQRTWCDTKTSFVVCFTSSYGPLEKARSTPVPVLHEDPDRLVYTCYRFKSHCASLNLEVHREFAVDIMCVCILTWGRRKDTLVEVFRLFFEVCAGSNSNILFCGSSGVGRSTVINRRIVSNSRVFHGQTWPESCWPSIRGKGFLQWEVSQKRNICPTLRYTSNHQIPSRWEWVRTF